MQVFDPRQSMTSPSFEIFHYRDAKFEGYDPALADRIEEKMRGAHMSYILRQAGIDPAKVIKNSWANYDK